MELIRYFSLKITDRLLSEVLEDQKIAKLEDGKIVLTAITIEFIYTIL